MIQPNCITDESDLWKKSLKNAFKDLSELLSYLKIDEREANISFIQNAKFPFKVTREYASRIEKNNLNDPLLRQVLPIESEKISGNDYCKDPLNETVIVDEDSSLIQKYNGRALLVTTGHCAIHCRYCFRKHYPYESHSGLKKNLEAIKQMQTRKDISEIILSGGDPLTLPDQMLSKIFSEIKKLKHIKRMRIHSRFPVVLPSRLTLNLLKILESQSIPIILVLHCNHPNEIDNEVAKYLKRTKMAGVTILNQSVLLKGINDCPEILRQLSEKLFENGALPYYVHLLDKVSGSEHFAVSDFSAKKIQAALYSELPAYLVPRFVKDIVGANSKVPI
tara:strand:- start:235 stop:1239 length:1005 start_codon:yes stop_codon:yes gene_type:complete